MLSNFGLIQETGSVSDSFSCNKTTLRVKKKNMYKILIKAFINQLSLYGLNFNVVGTPINE